ncbi:hypothetical protein KQH49_05560 [Mycetohabitans sp. B5]|uniref:hypothetical protein n=1 Tax=Mycetohabitans TaxID=2571159 RepID=UPI0011B039BA|nr:MULTISPECIES: hypothetical protein [Mycetohabitans]MCG1054455.1 hypothetical protein [Mycetohabitans sp. B5]
MNKFIDIAYFHFKPFNPGAGGRAASIMPPNAMGLYRIGQCPLIVASCHVLHSIVITPAPELVR